MWAWHVIVPSRTLASGAVRFDNADALKKKLTPVDEPTRAC
jgi:hypothetical protein